MTTVVSNLDSIAADSLAVLDGTRSSIKKLIRGPEGSVFGIAGAVTQCLAVVDYINGGEKGEAPDSLDDVIVLWLRRDGLFLLDGSAKPQPVLELFTAIGTGAQAALGAMHMGADPTEAVRVAAKIDVNTGGRVVTMKVKRK